MRYRQIISQLVLWRDEGTEGAGSLACLLDKKDSTLDH